MVKRSRKNLRRNRKTRRMRGGGWGFTGTNSIPGVPGTVSNPQVFTAIGDCRATEPGYWIPQSDYANYQKGLPGMNGGRRRNRKTNRKQKGGRYTFDLSPPSVNGVAPNAAAWWAGTYPPVQRIACEGSTPNPLNPGPHTPSTQPTPVASANLHLNPQSGGGTSPGTVGVGDVDSMYYYAPTAGYDNKPSTWVDSVGAPVQLQIPYAARELNPSCLTTGHPPPLTGALQKGGAGLLNTLTNGLKKVTNTVGLTRKNNANTSLNAAVGAVYNNVAPLTQNAVNNAPVANAVNNLSSITSNNNRNRNRNINENSMVYEEINENYNNENNANWYEPPNSVGGKRRKGKKSRKARKARKGRKGSRKH